MPGSVSSVGQKFAVNLLQKKNYGRRDLCRDGKGTLHKFKETRNGPKQTMPRVRIT